ncbi:unnamed protein product (macronuclear) [Paramecium tetraurelia]|uniref:Calponin-homology (CH) domain-containing protein n=1 Tax=Paramecium tetraurelia TaxID=5888 RepID=A0CXA4_PARTE|nr:uncharacterized protein GSPATT00011053001 [Paramecium tetraurelia]CAK75421.1 unnamed protein product [Paramecium tetraurelia]|eukprot:XP_001442818.1 hypothetical protein (macronuclear) [Paramecium tetraurelia strain d4-2]
MSHNAILKWIGYLVSVPEGTTLKDLSDGRILTNLLNKLNPEVYPQKVQSSPQKNFQMDMLCVTNLVQNLKQSIPNLPEINSLLIAKHQDTAEIIKLISIIIKIMIESQLAQEAILKLEEEQVQNILQFINEYQEEEVGNHQPSDRKLLDKIDELEDENQQLKQLLEKQDQQQAQHFNKIKQQEQLLVQKENEISELKLCNIYAIYLELQKKHSYRRGVLSKELQQKNQNYNQQQSIKTKKKLSEQNENVFIVSKQFRLQHKLQNYSNLENINLQLQQELAQRCKQDKVIEELKTNIEILKQQMDQKDTKISKLQDQMKQTNQNQQKECSKLVELEMQNEQLKQEIEDTQRSKNKEIHQLHQKLNELKIQVDTIQTERQETQRSSVHYQQSPRCLDSEFKTLLNDNIGGYYSEQTIQEFQLQIQQKEQQLQQKEILYDQKIKTLEAKINKEKDTNIQHIQITSQLQEDNKKLKFELEKLIDTNYQVSRIHAEKQQNMLLISVIECLNEKVNQLHTQSKEHLKSDKKIQPQILSRNSISLWSAKQ